jgi:hypothetical protein
MELEKNVFSPPVEAYLLLALSYSGVFTRSVPLGKSDAAAVGFRAVGEGAGVNREAFLYDAVFAAMGSSPPAALGAKPCFFLVDCHCCAVSAGVGFAPVWTYSYADFRCAE